MVLNTISVGAAVTPTVIETYFAHYIKRKSRRQKPTAHISYHEGLELIRHFLVYASHHTVEDLQAFTSQWVPNPRWVKVDEATIPQEHIDKAAATLIAQLGHKGVNQVGGSEWWRWRREGSLLKAEWIEMRAHYARRKRSGEKIKRVMLYVHGGAYFFGSVDEHRYQLQRHARKLEARVFARSARYRLAPQFPFPCGLHDCLAAYIFLLTQQDPSTIILTGDSAGGGMVMSMLIIIRDQNLPLPAGAVLISPWVDLTHSFPSLCDDDRFDYIPAHGFLHRPSAAWPPPNVDDMEAIALHAVEKAVGDDLPRKSSQQDRRKATQEAVQGFSEEHNSHHPHPVKNANNPADTSGSEQRPGHTIPGPGHDLSIMLDGKLVHIKDQIQMYTTNQLMSHPLVSPALQPSLGGLPPLLILTGGGELLRDEQIYLAHKAANPIKYPPSEAYLEEHPEKLHIISKYKPTDVQLQVWDDLCHVAPTLSFTRPAKHMFRSISQFGAWALARAQKADIEIMDDDDISVISSGSNTDSSSSNTEKPAQVEPKMKNGVVHGGIMITGSVGKAGQALPPFQNHMIRQRVDRHGDIFPLEPASSMPALQLSPNEIGFIKPGPVRKWLAAKQEWDTKYAKEKRRVQKQRITEMAAGYQDFEDDDVPPPSALAGRRGRNMPKEQKKGRSWGMSLWSLWGSKHDETTMEREERADKNSETMTAAQMEASHDGAADTLKSPLSNGSDIHSRSRSRRRTVTDTGQVNGFDEGTPVAELFHRRGEQAPPLGTANPLVDDTGTQDSGNVGTHLSVDSPTGVKNTPLRLCDLEDAGVNASTVALKDYRGLRTPREEVDRQLGGGGVAGIEEHRPAGQERPELESGVGAQDSGNMDNHLSVDSPIGVKNTPLTLRGLGDASVNASTVALKDYGGLRTPREEVDRQLGGGEVASIEEHRPVGGAGREWSELERFETAREGV